MAVTITMPATRAQAPDDPGTSMALSIDRTAGSSPATAPAMPQPTRSSALSFEVRAASTTTARAKLIGAGREYSRASNSAGSGAVGDNAMVAAPSTSETAISAFGVNRWPSSTRAKTKTNSG